MFSYMGFTMFTVRKFSASVNTAMENAPKAEPYLIVIVEEAEINEDTVNDFEACISRKILEKFTINTTPFSHCEFYYTSLSHDLILEGE